mgnify:FL=1
MWISKQEAKEYRTYQQAVPIILRGETDAVVGDQIVYLSRSVWDEEAKRLKQTMTRELEVVRAEAEEWKHKYADEFQKRMALLNRMIEDNADA